MNRKIIKSIITKKLNDWVSSIKDPEVQKLAKKNTVVTGGSIANLLLNEEPKDYDLYFRDKGTAFAIAQYYVNEFNLAHPGTEATLLDGETVNKKQYGNAAATLTPDRLKIHIQSKGVASENEDLLNSPFEDAVQAISDADHIDENMLENTAEAKSPYRPVFLSPNAITLANKIQLVIRFYGEPDAIHENYDFVHCTNYFDFGSGELVLKQEALECLMNKELRYIGSKYPICSVIRTRKFLKRNFHINAGQYLKMCFQISKLDLTDLNVLEDQLVGVDSSYFVMLIEALRDQKEKDPTFKIEQSYVASIIDRIF